MTRPHSTTALRIEDAALRENLTLGSVTVALRWADGGLNVSIHGDQRFAADEARRLMAALDCHHVSCPRPAYVRGETVWLEGVTDDRLAVIVYFAAEADSEVAA